MSLDKTFKLGITMAGAVSAGAYTAGVIDYLLEALDKWNKAKAIGDPTIPMHNVILEVLGGASAGGMTAAVTCLGLLKGIKSYGDGGREDNALYDLWVNMVDSSNNFTIDQMLNTSDVEGTEELHSFLNSDVIDEVGKKAINIDATNTDNFPPYISSDLDLIMTISNLRGIPLKIIFDNNIAPTTIVKHDGQIHYKFKKNTAQDSMLPYKVFDFSEKDFEELKERAIATGAFPFGFKPIKLKMLNTYIRTYFESKYKDELKQNSLSYDESLFKKEGVYDFVAVDGGMLNNEPLALTYNALQESGIKENEKDHAIIMIDPFPSNVKLNSEYECKTDVISIAKDIVKSLMNQAKYRQEDLFKAISDDELTRFFIAPRRHGRDEGEALACGSFGGFSGFFKKDFRAHDFQMGRKNCSDFLRYHFALPESDNNEIHKDWTDDMRKRFRFYKTMKLNKATNQWERGQLYLPIIPDVAVTKAEGTPPLYQKHLNEANQQVVRNVGDSLHYFDFPSISETQVRNYEEKINSRVKACIKKLLSETKLSRITRWYGSGLASKKITKTILNHIITEGKSYGIVKK